MSQVPAQPIYHRQIGLVTQLCPQLRLRVLGCRAAQLRETQGGTGRPLTQTAVPKTGLPPTGGDLCSDPDALTWGSRLRAVTTQTGHVSFLGEELVILPGLQERPEGLTDRPQKDLCLNGKLRGCGFVTCELTIPGRAALASAPVFLFCVCSYGCFC